jgi:hypothetical protein
MWRRVGEKEEEEIGFNEQDIQEREQYHIKKTDFLLCAKIGIKFQIHLKCGKLFTWRKPDSPTFLEKWKIGKQNS